VAVYVTFERGRDDAKSITFGPFSYVQVTYDTLCVEDSVVLAIFDRGPFREKRLRLSLDTADRDVLPEKHAAFYSGIGSAWWIISDMPDGIDDWYSDFIVFSDGGDSLLPRGAPHGFVTLNEGCHGQKPVGFWKE